MSIQNTSEVPTAKLATGEQVEHIMDMWRRRLKGRNLTLDEANHLIQNGGQYLPIMDEAADVLVDRVRSDTSNTIVRMVRNIRRGRTAEEAVSATGRKKHVDDFILATMPVGEGPEEVELVYYKPDPSEYDNDNFMSEEGIEKASSSRGLCPDLQAQMADNEQDPSFADDHPNGMSWNRVGKVASFAAFGRWRDRRRVIVDRHNDDDWDDCWWFAGVRK